MELFLAIIISISMVLCVVAVHHEVSVVVGKMLLPKFITPSRWHISFTVLVFVCAHIAEIAICAFLLFISADILSIGQLVGATSHGFETYIYYSFASYTALGIGDIFPIGYLRILTGLEALLGLMMIGWTASFIFLEMRNFWLVEQR